eukprot:31222-Pelagococcus_subviridis.AAC.3
MGIAWAWIGVGEAYLHRPTLSRRNFGTAIDRRFDPPFDPRTSNEISAAGPPLLSSPGPERVTGTSA